MGTNICCRKGYSASEEIRQNAASGGMVTALLCHMLETGAIDGAWVTKSRIHDGKLDYHTFIATTKEEIMSASSSIYMEMPLMKHMDMVRSFDGKLAVVLTPCMMRAFNAALEKDEALKNRVVMKIGLFCSGNYSEKATTLPLEKLKISLDHAVRLYYRRGHWRGIASVLYENGEEARFSYPKTICAYKNAGFFEKKSCMYCQDHFASGADISVGDIWLSSMKKDSHKHTCCIIRTEQAKAYYQDAVNAGKIVDSSISRRDVLRGQKRALVTKFHCAAAKKNDKLDVSEKCGWNHRLAYFLLEHDRRFSEEHEAVLRKIPMKLIYYYMCFIRVLLSF
jgi:coenzyme F420-reducing hydrogenase beta subunit